MPRFSPPFDVSIADRSRSGNRILVGVDGGSFDPPDGGEDETWVLYLPEGSDFLGASNVDVTLYLAPEGSENRGDPLTEVGQSGEWEATFAVEYGSDEPTYVDVTIRQVFDGEERTIATDDALVSGTVGELDEDVIVGPLGDAVRSATQSADSISQATSTDNLPDHTCNDEDANARVFLNGVRVPVGDCEIFIRREGQADVARMARVEVASPYDGTHYISSLRGILPDVQDSLDRIRVDAKDWGTGAWATVFHGTVTAAGPGPGPEKMWTVRGRGPALYLDKIPAGKNFSQPVSAFGGDGVFTFVVDTLEDKLPFVIETNPDGVQIADDEDHQDVRYIPFGGEITHSRIETSKTYRRNRHHLGDPLEWYSDKISKRVWFEPTREGVLFVVTDEPTQRRHRAHYLGGDLTVISNQALQELNPLNTLIVNGQPIRSSERVGDYEADAPTNVFFRARARQTEIYQRAGNTEFADTDETTDAKLEQEVKEEARSRLKDQIDNDIWGSVTTMLRVPISCFDTLTLKPTCEGSPATELSPLEYEVQKIKHDIPAGSTPTTTAEVSLKTDPNKDIEVTGSWLEVQ